MTSIAIVTVIAGIEIPTAMQTAIAETLNATIF
jgi:hypothetical protein